MYFTGWQVSPIKEGGGRVTPQLSYALPPSSYTPSSFCRTPTSSCVVYKRGVSALSRDYATERLLLGMAKKDPLCNIRSNVMDRIGANLHLKQGHPLNIMKRHIEGYFNSVWRKRSNTQMKIFDDLSPVMNTIKAFDELLIPVDHPSRKPSDTYYLSNDILLRPHTSAHQNEIMKAGITSFLCSGDVYRRDAIDATHFPIFHQMEGVHVFDRSFLEKLGGDKEQKEFVVNDMKETLEGLAKYLFGDVKFKWNDEETFPFTDPSFEVDIFFKEKWLEVLGCGVIQQKILENCNFSDRKGWAFGLGLERLAMILFEIPDIRLFWSTDPRFLQQFSAYTSSSPPKTHIKFQHYSKHEICTKDISFWLPPEGYHDNSFYDLVRDIARELVEDVVLIDTFINPATGKTSKCYRINYRSMDKNLTNKEVGIIQDQIRSKVVHELGVILR